MTRGIELFVFESKKLSAYFQIYDSNYWTFSEQNSQNWTPLKIWLAEHDLFWKIWLIEIEPFFSTWVKENDSIFDHDLKNISFSIFDSKNNDFFFGNNDPKNWTFFEETYMTLRIELFFTKSKNWSFLPIWFTPRIQAFWTFSYDSKNWTCFKMSQKLNRVSKWLKEFNLFSKWLKELNLFLKMTQNFCSLELTQNWFFDYDS